MVAFVVEDLPNEINSIEGLAVWALSVLSNVHSISANVERQGDPPTLNATLAPFDIRAADSEWNYSVSQRAIGRISIPLAADYQTKKIWESALPLGLGDEPIPPQFL